MEMVESGIWTGFLIGLYFVPAIVAHVRRHKNQAPIFLTNLIFGWTGIGWLIAIIWSMTAFVDAPKE